MYFTRSKVWSRLVCSVPFPPTGCGKTKWSAVPIHIYRRTTSHCWWSLSLSTWAVLSPPTDSLAGGSNKTHAHLAPTKQQHEQPQQTNNNNKNHHHSTTATSRRNSCSSNISPRIRCNKTNKSTHSTAGNSIDSVSARTPRREALGLALELGSTTSPNTTTTTITNDLTLTTTMITTAVTSINNRNNQGSRATDHGKQHPQSTHSHHRFRKGKNAASANHVRKNHPKAKTHPIKPNKIN